MRKLLRFLFWVAVVLGGIVGILRAVALRWWQVPLDDVYMTTSLTPSIGAGDWVLLWRATPPSYGDLAMCQDPQDSTRFVMGRIAAETGMRIRVEDSNVVVDEKRQPTERACLENKFTIIDPKTGNQVEQSCSVEVLGNHSHPRGNVVGERIRVTPVTYEVTKGKVFLLSDNREYPFDSRDYGLVDRSTCVESVFFRLWGTEGYADVQSRFTFIQ